MTEDNKDFSISLPGEWAIRKVLGPTMTEFGEDLKYLYTKGRDKIFAAAQRKINDPEDGQRANLRVARDVLWNGAFTDEDICAEYFGGILAASRSSDGNNDETIQFVEVTKSLSSKQLHLHYIIYCALNKRFVACNKKINVGQGTEMNSCEVWFAAVELERDVRLRLETDLNVLLRMGLLHEFITDTHKPHQVEFSVLFIRPTTFGVLLYAAAHNRLNEWRKFNSVDFGTFHNITMPEYFKDKDTVSNLIVSVG